MKNLYEIGMDMAALDHLLEERGGDVTDPAVMAAVDQWAAELVNDEAVKLEGYAQYLKHLEMERVAAEAEAEQWKHKARTREARIKFLKDRLLSHLIATGRTEAVTASGRKISVRKNGGLPPVIVNDDLDLAQVPTSLIKLKAELNTLAVRTLLIGGGSLPFARLGEPGRHIRID